MPLDEENSPENTSLQNRQEMYRSASESKRHSHEAQADSIKAKERSKEIRRMSRRLIQIAQDHRAGLDDIDDIARAAEEMRQVAEEVIVSIPQ